MEPDHHAENAARGQITALLRRHRAGDASAFDELAPVIYHRLRRIAQQQLSRDWSLDTLGATALVHEAYVQLVGETGVDWQGRSHFYAVSARVMRRILVDYARRRRARKRGGPARPDVPLDQVDVACEPRLELVLAVDEALATLEAFNPRLARLVECRFFAGMTEQEAAVALGVPLRTAQREWTRARAWLLKELADLPRRPRERASAG